MIWPMNAVLFGTRCRHVNVIPVKVDVTHRGIVHSNFMPVFGIVKTTARGAVHSSMHYCPRPVLLSTNAKLLI